MFSIYDYGVLLFYFVFLVTIGFVTKKLVNNTSDYFRGGGKMLWWMTGASAFMVQFSAWTFTGAASEAYLNGPIVIVIFFGNALGFLANYMFFAPKFRQMRVVTAIQAVKQRFGVSGEQFFTWLQLPLGILNAGIWLIGLSIFISSVFGIPLQLTIICTGLVVIFNSTIAGAWAVASSDFMQVVILMMIAVATAIYSTIEIGGVVVLGELLTENDFWGDNINYPALTLSWCAVMLVSQFFKTNHMIDASRYLNAKNSKNAKKAALLSCVLFIVGPILWFIPPIVAKSIYPELGTLFPMLAKPSEAAYVAIAIKTLPQGMVGLLMAGMFAATISSMDSGLNRNAGVFVKNVYLNFIRPNASEKDQMVVAKITTVIFGITIISTALYYSTLRQLGLFDLMIQIGALLGIPLAVPLVWGLIVKKTPSWSGWSTTCVGLLCSALIKYYFNSDWFVEKYNFDFTSRDSRYWEQTLSVTINVIVPSLWFFSTRLFYKDPVGQRKEELELFWLNQKTPVEDVGHVSADGKQGSIMGGLAAAYGVFVVMLSLIPNPISGRIIFVVFGFTLILLGYYLYSSTIGKSTLVRKFDKEYFRMLRSVFGSNT